MAKEAERWNAVGGLDQFDGIVQARDFSNEEGSGLKKGFCRSRVYCMARRL